MKRQVFSPSQVLHVSFVLFLRKCPMSLVMLFAHIGKRSNQPFTDVLQTRKNLCWSLFLIKFQDWRPAFLFKKRLQHRYFSVNIAKCLKQLFYRGPVHYTFPIFYTVIPFLMIDNWYFRVMFYYCRIRPRKRKNFATDWSFFFFLLFNISLLQRCVCSSNCKEKLVASNWKILENFGFKF